MKNWRVHLNAPALCCAMHNLYLGIVPPVALWAVFMGKKVKTASKNVQDSLASATEVAEEKISNIRTVRLVSTDIKVSFHFLPEFERFSSQVALLFINNCSWTCLLLNHLIQLTNKSFKITVPCVEKYVSFLFDLFFCRIFAKEKEEIIAYKERMDKVIQASVKEALIQVFKCT